jgi:hypothetical protein
MNKGIRSDTLFHFRFLYSLDEIFALVFNYIHI